MSKPCALALVVGLLVSTISLGALSPATAALGNVTVAMTCAADELPSTERSSNELSSAEACGGDMVRLLELLQRTQQFQQIQEEEEHHDRDPVAAGPASHGRALFLPEPLLLAGEDMSLGLLRPPRALTV